MLLSARVVILLVLVDIAVSLVPNVTNVKEVENDLRGLETRRRKRRRGKNKKSRSTSSEEGGFVERSSSEDQESLGLSSRDTSSSSTEEQYKPKSSVERKGWRKWHRKCQQCPDDMAKKWRDPTIKWICGAYQRARRSFKSLCMMHYRNCQDGTMFVKIHDYRCANDTPRDPRPHGIHFFYDYKVALSEDSSQSVTEDTSQSDESSEGW